MRLPHYSDIAKLLLIMFIASPSPIMAQRTWTKLEQFPKTRVTCITVNRNGSVFAGTSGDGLYRSTNHGKTWVQLSTAATGLFITCVGTDMNDILYVGTYETLLASSNDGVTFQILSTGSAVMDFAFNEGNGYAAQGNSQSRLDGFNPPVYLTSNGSPYAMALNDRDDRYVAYFLPNDEDVHMEYYDQTPVRHDFGAIDGAPAIPGLNPVELLLRDNAFVFLGCSTGLWRSKQSQANWQKLGTGLGNAQVTTLSICRDTLYAGGYDSGIVYSADDGDSWNDTNIGLVERSITAIASGPDGWIYAGTERGLYRSLPPEFKDLCDTTLVFHDDFDDKTIDTTIWGFFRGPNPYNGELQYYTDTNATIANGKLVITAHRDSNYLGSGYDYTSARLHTYGKMLLKYGVLEARIKFPSGKGLWPAFWMLGDSYYTLPYPEWPRCGEVDIMEHINSQNINHGVMHWLSDSTYLKAVGTTPCSADEYHVFRLVWNAGCISWYVDGEKFYEYDIYDNLNNTEAFHEPFHILLNLAVGGNWPGHPDSSTVFPARMYVDYLKIFHCDSQVINDTYIATVPHSIELQHIYPNPVRELLTLQYTVPHHTRARIVVYDLLGRVVSVISDATVIPGVHTTRFDASGLSAGTYITRLETGVESVSRLFIVVR